VKQKIDPWKSFEVKDYDKLMKQFGIEKIDSVKIPKEHPYFTRGLVFGHKSLQTLFEAKKKKKSFAMMTGLMPSGRFHLGHKLVADLMVYFQGIGAECYVTVADIESYLTRGISLEDARKVAIEEYLLNYIALGLKPKKLKFYFQTEGSKNYMNLSKFISKRTTYNELKDIYGDITPEKMISAFTQVADILHPQLKENGGPKPVVIPVGIDQLPHINLSRDVANRMKGEFQFIPPSAIFLKLLPGLKGGKMSSSEPNSAIFLTDDKKTVKKKIGRALTGGRETVEEQRKKGAEPDKCMVFKYLYYLFEFDDKAVKLREKKCKTGKLLCSECKADLTKEVNTFLTKHNKAREKAKKNYKKFL